jgi:hypothetical protein
MENNIKKYLENIISEISESVLPNMKMRKIGYENFLMSGKESYAKRLGRELIQNNIPFESLFDIGYGKIDSEYEDFAKHYEDVCKKTPNHIFLKDILSTGEQKDILLKTINNFDFNGCFGDFTKISSMLHILRDFKTIGVDKSLVNEEITNTVKEYFNNSYQPHPNIIVAFINEGFCFDEEFMEKKFKPSFKITFGHLGQDCNEKIRNIYCSNTENRIKLDYNMINRSLPVNEEVKAKKRKI